MEVKRFFVGAVFVAGMIGLAIGLLGSMSDIGGGRLKTSLVAWTFASSITLIMTSLVMMEDL